MTNAEQRESARKFINAWQGKGYEKGDTQRFWMSLLSDVLGVNNVADKIEFEKESSDLQYYSRWKNHYSSWTGYDQGQRYGHCCNYKYWTK